MEKEEWVYIKDFEGLYCVNKMGEVKSISRVVSHKHMGHKTISEKIKKHSMSRGGYPFVHLSKNNLNKNKSLHRIIAEAFIPNIENKTEVNHKNGDKTDFSIDNLEWCTPSENMLHSFRVLKRKHSQSMLGRTGILNPKSKKVYCPTLSIGFGSAREASRIIGISQGTISDICCGRQLHRDGLIFNYLIN